MSANNKVSKSIQEDFEFLMGMYLADEISVESNFRLKYLIANFPQLEQKYKNYTSIQSIIKDMPAGSFAELGAEFSDQSSVAVSNETQKIEVEQDNLAVEPVAAMKEVTKVIPIDQKKKNKKSVFVASSIAATLLIVIGSILIYMNFFAIRDSSAKMLTFPHRQCESGGQAMKSGGQQLGPDLSSGSDSFCDAQINENGNQVAIRVLPDSSVDFIENANHSAMELVRGSMVVFAKKSERNEIRIYAGENMVSVLGTRFLVRRLDPDTVKIEMLDGSAQIKTARFLNIKSLRNLENAQREALLKSRFSQWFLDNTEIVESGKTITISHKKGYHHSSQEFINAINKELDVAPEQRSPEFVINTLDRLTGANPQIAKKILNDQPQIRQEKQTAEYKWLMQRWAQNLELLPDEGVIPEKYFIQKAQKINPEAVIRALKERKAPALLYRILLKNGTKVTGIVEQEGNQYRLTTNQGEILIPKTEVINLEIFYE